MVSSEGLWLLRSVDEINNDRSLRLITTGDYSTVLQYIAFTSISKLLHWANSYIELVIWHFYSKLELQKFT